MAGVLRKYMLLLATLAVFLLLFAIASLYEGFLSWYSIRNLFRFNPALALAAIGMTFVILSGGIDLSVASMVALVATIIAVLIENLGLHPLLAIAIGLAVGTAGGATMGALIRYFALPPFLVTLAGMFLFRGMAFVIYPDVRLDIKHAFYRGITQFNLTKFPVEIFVFLGTLGLAVYLAHYTRFGRNVYAIGGNEQSAVLMGLPVGRTKIRIYALSGFCAALGGVLFSFGGAGDAAAVMAMELDAIAAVVIGGTMLTGGVGYVFGTLLGVLILGIIQTIITNEDLDSSWTKIATGLLLLGFILVQRLLQRHAAGSER